MEKDLASLNISNKAEAPLGAKALNGALHDDTSFLTWAVLSISWAISRRVCALTRSEPAAAMGDACIIISDLETRLVAPPSMGACVV
jgi:hypothetical protein